MPAQASRSFERAYGRHRLCPPGLPGDWEKPGAKEEGGADLALLCPLRTAVTLDTSMGTEAEAIQSSPRFFLVSFQASSQNWHEAYRSSGETTQLAGC
jgi:hypothetical protein